MNINKTYRDVGDIELSSQVWFNMKIRTTGKIFLGSETKGMISLITSESTSNSKFVLVSGLQKSNFCYCFLFFKRIF